MSATTPASKTELKDYALRRLGFPTIDINVATEQLDDLVELQLTIGKSFHYDGYRKQLNKIEVTEVIKTTKKGNTAIDGTLDVTGATT